MLICLWDTKESVEIKTICLAEARKNKMPSQNEVTSSNKISRGDDIIFDRSV